MANLKSKTEELRKIREEEFATAPPSRVIEMALEDLEECEALPGAFTIDMTVFYDRRPDGRCGICLAGAVMANRLRLVQHQRPNVVELDITHGGRLQALDFFRMGNIALGLEAMMLAQLPIKFVDVAKYQDDPAKFKSDMRALAETLRKAGL